MRQFQWGIYFRVVSRAGILCLFYVDIYLVYEAVGQFLWLSESIVLKVCPRCDIKKYRVSTGSDMLSRPSTPSDIAYQLIVLSSLIRVWTTVPYLTMSEVESLAGTAWFAIVGGRPGGRLVSNFTSKVTGDDSNIRITYARQYSCSSSTSSNATKATWVRSPFPNSTANPSQSLPYSSLSWSCILCQMQCFVWWKHYLSI